MYLLQRIFLFLSFICLAVAAIAQPKLEFSLKKPKQFEERKLGSEKSADKKFTFMRRAYQNTNTHFNYYFNANNKLNDIIAEAAAQNKDNYTKLLNFYPYSLEQTAKSNYIDTILQKCTAGILLHDLRNDWIDNLYLVMGKAYLLRKNYDSAAMTFQYLNYSYAPKEKDGYDQTIGSNDHEGSNAFSISTKEKKGITAYTFTGPPSRNEAFLWQVRTLTENSEYIDASSLIETLRNDPNFPLRLKEELSEARAYMYYRLQMWDSSATHLIKAVATAPNPDLKARWHYLAGQMYQLANAPEKAAAAYAKCTDIAIDPVLEIYARLNSIRLRKSSDPKIIEDNIATLMAMSKKDRYTNYRDLIYYAAGLFELERNGYDVAEKYLQKSIAYNLNNPGQRSLSFLQLADMQFVQKKYSKASLPYDSTETTLLNDDDAKRVLDRRPGTNKIFAADEIITLQDSLLKIANLPEPQRTDFVKQYSKKLRKARGLKEELDAAQNFTGNAGPTAASAPSDLFSATAGKWYFADMNQRTTGFQKFKDRWGARQNNDNWRRSASQKIAPPAGNETSPDATLVPTTGLAAGEAEIYDTADISFDNLYSRLPIADDKKTKANNRINNALYAKATALLNDIEDYPEAIKVYELLLSRIDTGALAEKSWLALVYCYTKTGNLTAANAARQKLDKQFGNKTLTDLPIANKKKNEAGTSAYKDIYNLFLEGKFDDAVRKKSVADSMYGTYFWTPQLLYIQSVYEIKSRQDSLAIKTLTQIENSFAGHPLANRATTMKEVLGRRKEIEDYLTNLKITRATEDEVKIFSPDPISVKPQQNDSTLQANLKNQAEKQRLMDSTITANKKTFAQSEEAKRKDSLAQANAALKADMDRKRDSTLQANLRLKAETERKRDSTEQAQLQKKADAEKRKDSLAQAKLAKQLEDSRRKDSTAQALRMKQAETARIKDSTAQALRMKQAETTRIKDSIYQADLKRRQDEALLKKDANLQAQLAREAEASKAKQAAAELALAKQLAAEKRLDSLAQVQLKKQEDAARRKDSLAQAQLKKQENDARRKDSLAQLQLAKQAETMRIKDSTTQAQLMKKADEMRIKDSLAAVKLAQNLDAKRVADSLKLIEDYKKSNPKKPAVFVINNIVSPYLIAPTGKQLVGIVLEKIDPAYVNEVMYSFNSNPRRNLGDTLVQAIKVKLEENSWLVLLQSANFNSAQDAIDYIEYIKPLAKSNIIAWLDENKYSYIIISPANLEILKQDKNINLYQKVLNATIPAKF